MRFIITALLVFFSLSVCAQESKAKPTSSRVCLEMLFNNANVVLLSEDIKLNNDGSLYVDFGRGYIVTLNPENENNKIIIDFYRDSLSRSFTPYSVVAENDDGRFFYLGTEYSKQLSPCKLVTVAKISQPKHGSNPSP